MSISFAVRDELSFPVELQQSVAAEAEAKRQHQVRVSNSIILPEEPIFFFNNKMQFLLTLKITQCLKLSCC